MSTIPLLRKHPLHGIRRLSVDFKNGLYSVALTDSTISASRLDQGFELDAVLRVDRVGPRLEAEFRAANNVFKIGLGRVNNVARALAIRPNENH